MNEARLVVVFRCDESIRFNISKCRHCNSCAWIAISQPAHDAERNDRSICLVLSKMSGSMIWDSMEFNEQYFHHFPIHHDVENAIYTKRITLQPSALRSIYLVGGGRFDPKHNYILNIYIYNPSARSMIRLLSQESYSPCEKETFVLLFF